MCLFWFVFAFRSFLFHGWPRPSNMYLLLCLVLLMAKHSNNWFRSSVFCFLQLYHQRTPWQGVLWIWDQYLPNKCNENLELLIRLTESLPPTHPPFARSDQHSDCHPCIRVLVLYRAPTEPYRTPTYNRLVRSRLSCNNYQSMHVWSFSCGYDYACRLSSLK